MSVLDLTEEQLEEMSSGELIFEVLALQDELEKTRINLAHKELANRRLADRCESLQNEKKILSQWQREAVATVQRIEELLDKHEAGDAVYYIRRVVECEEEEV